LTHGWIIGSGSKHNWIIGFGKPGLSGKWPNLSGLVDFDKVSLDGWDPDPNLPGAWALG
jgi:hypothetical protein